MPFVTFVMTTYIGLLVARLFVPMGGEIYFNPLLRALVRVTEPVVRLVRTRIFITRSGLDLAPLVAAALLAVGRGFRTNAAGVDSLRKLLNPLGVEVLDFHLPYGSGPGDVLHARAIDAARAEGIHRGVHYRRALVLAWGRLRGIFLRRVHTHTILTDWSVSMLPHAHGVNTLGAPLTVLRRRVNRHRGRRR